MKNAFAIVKTRLHGITALCVRLRWIVFGTLAFFLFAIAGAYGWNRYQYHQGPEYAYEVLHTALLSSHAEKLATMVDFTNLATDFAQWIVRERPQTARSEDVMDLSDAIQQRLLKALEQARSTVKPKAVPVASPADAPLIPLPDNALTQLAATLSLQSAQQGVALLRAEIIHEQAHRTFVVNLLLEHRQGLGWILTRVANAQDIVRQFVEAEQEIARKREEAFADRNRAAQRRMDAQVSVFSCTAHIKKVPSQDAPLLTVTVVGYNAGAMAIRNLNLAVRFSGAGVHMMRHVNIAQRIMPGEHFTHVWDTDMVNSPEDAVLDAVLDAALSRADPLHCTPRPHSMVLSSGEWLYIEDKTP